MSFPTLHLEVCWICEGCVLTFVFADTVCARHSRDKGTVDTILRIVLVVTLYFIIGVKSMPINVTPTKTMDQKLKWS